MRQKYKYSLQIYQFVKEALNLNAQLMQQKEVMCQKILQINPYCEIRNKLTSQVVDMRLEYEEIHKIVYDFITQQESEEGRNDDFPKPKESHKDILFTDWDSQLKKVERATTIMAVATKNIRESINKNRHGANLVAESIPRFLSNAKQLEQLWRQVEK